MRDPATGPPTVVDLGIRDLPLIAGLLASSGLGADGLEAGHVRLLGAFDEGRLVGCAALEILGGAGLLRSVAVAPEWRGRGMGRALVAEAEGTARRGGLKMMYLLTETAERFFTSLGYRPVAREALPDAIKRSGQVVSMCPASAVAMTRNLFHPD